MKISRFAAAFFFSLWASFASANVPCTLPFNLQNNTVADATQVMANYNALVTCLGNAAVAGVNNDLTQLLGLSTPIAPTFGGSSKFIGGNSTGSANAQVVSVSPTGFSLTQGYQVTFTSAFNNTGPTTLNIAGTGVINAFRQTTAGVVALVGGELLSGFRTTVEYDGTQFQIVNAGIIKVGQIFDVASTTCPLGAPNANSQAISRTIWAALFSQIGATWGAGDGSTTFNVPDLRGRATYGQDQNIGGFSNRITVAGGNFDGTLVANVGGLQNSTALLTHTHTITDPGHVHSFTGSFGAQYSGGSSTAPFVNSATTNTASATTGINATNSSGAGTSYSILAPASIATKCIQA